MDWQQRYFGFRMTVGQAFLGAIVLLLALIAFQLQALPHRIAATSQPQCGHYSACEVQVTSGTVKLEGDVDLSLDTIRRIGNSVSR